MRNVKFRGFLDLQQRWIYGNLIVDKNGNKYIVENKSFSPDGHHLVYNPSDEPMFIKQETIGQYTGMKESNGTEIYEGDIVHCYDEANRIVEWVQDNGSWELQMLPNGDYIDPLFFDDFEECEVIGNRWDNPEMLRGDISD